MANTAITVGVYTFTFNDGDIASVEEIIGAKAENVELAGQGPMGNINYDYDGTTKFVIIKGTLTPATTTRISGYSITTVLAQKQWLESMINGSQDAITLTDDFAGQSVLQKTGATPPYLGAFTTTKCVGASCTFRRDQGKPNQCPFEIRLQIGTKQ